MPREFLSTSNDRIEKINYNATETFEEKTLNGKYLTCLYTFQNDIVTK